MADMSELHEMCLVFIEDRLLPQGIELHEVLWLINAQNICNFIRNDLMAALTREENLIRLNAMIPNPNQPTVEEVIDQLLARNEELWQLLIAVLREAVEDRRFRLKFYRVLNILYSIVKWIAFILALFLACQFLTNVYLLKWPNFKEDCKWTSCETEVLPQNMCKKGTLWQIQECEEGIKVLCCDTHPEYYGLLEVFLPGEYNLQRVSLNCEVRKANEENVKFYLAHREQSKLQWVNREDENAKQISKAKKVIIVIHGLVSSIEGPAKDLTRGLVKLKNDAVIFGVDWSLLAGTKSSMGVLCYLSVIENLPIVSATVIKFMREFNIHPSSTHIICHSLGCHISGMIGQALRKERIAEITALDVAAPLFHKSSPYRRLHNDDAVKVTVFHTSTYQYFGAIRIGQRDAIGKKDVYFEGGQLQKSCGKYDINFHHGVGITYILELYLMPNIPVFVTKCNDISEAESHRCDQEKRVLLKIPFEELYNDNASIFYGETNPKPPFLII